MFSTLRPSRRLRTRLAQRSTIAARVLEDASIQKTYLATLLGVSVRSISRGQLLLRSQNNTLLRDCLDGKVTLTEAERQLLQEPSPETFDASMASMVSGGPRGRTQPVDDHLPFEGMLADELQAQHD